ncbi:alpha/beta hydrolase family protein [Glaciecola sp. 1036]|uniref:alpha/beta hydrolase family protein n=1 Tax=Alteromonadaceae TaxID=72275 RepID=UPI003D06915D
MMAFRLSFIGLLFLSFSAFVSGNQDKQSCEQYHPTDFSALPTITSFPDPFLLLDGKSITTKSQWECVRKQTKAKFEHWELGEKPTSPAIVKGEISKDKLLVQAGNNEKLIEFTADISLPKQGSAPYPAIIALGRFSLDKELLNDAGVAVITLNNNQLGEQFGGHSRGKGKFFDLYGAEHSASAMIAWSWGVSRILDVLEASEQSMFDSSRIGITGCSRNGKGAIVAGAFDDRLVLTIAQESGSGGSASWRLSDYQRSIGQNVQTQSQIVTENVWFREDFKQFSGKTAKIPVDHHQLMGLIAPRGLLVIENTSMEWLGNLSSFYTANLAKTIWQAHGVPENIAIHQVGGYQHCQLPEAQKPLVKKYIEHFLLGEGELEDEINFTDGNYKFTVSDWQPWNVPKLNH